MGNAAVIGAKIHYAALALVSKCPAERLLERVEGSDVTELIPR